MNFYIKYIIILIYFNNIYKFSTKLNFYLMGTELSIRGEIFFCESLVIESIISLLLKSYK